MNNQNHNKYLFIFMLLILTLFLTACGASVEKLNKRGNEAYTKQMYEEALVAYQAAQIESPELAEPYYNAANTLYRQGNYAEAVKQLSYALNFADQESIKQSGLYNLGNNAYNSQELEPAVEAYKEALLIDAYDQDAKYNLELALQQQEQQQQEQEQEQQQQEQEQQENQEGNQDQDSEGEDSEENDNQNNEGDNQEDQSQSEGDQNQDSESSEDQQGEEDQNKDQSEQQNEGNQGDQEGQNDQSQGEGQHQDQEADNQDQDRQDGQVLAPGQRMTEEQAEQLLAAIAQDMETLQERLGQVLFVQDLPPTQDW